MDEKTKWMLGLWTEGSHSARLPRTETTRTSTGIGKREPVGYQGRITTGQSQVRPTLPSVRPGALKELDDGLCLTGVLCGKPIKFLVDTGANITIVKASCLDDMPVKPELRSVDQRMALTDGSSLPFVGRGLCKLQFGDTQVEHPVWVAKIEPEGILGLDCFQDYGCELVRKNGHYQLAMGNTKENQLQRPAPPCYRRVAVNETTVIPPKSEAMVRARVVDAGGPMIGVLEPTSRLMTKNKLILARILVDTGQGVVPPRLLNPTDKPYTLYKNTVAATCEPAEIISMPDERRACVVNGKSTDGQVPKCDPVPEHLAELFEWSSKDLDPEERTDLASLLSEFSDVFAASPSDLGRTDVVRHWIDTGSSMPTRQRARRLPVHRRNEADEHVRDMLDRGIIESSNSPWASPIVLVKRRMVRPGSASTTGP